MNKKLFTPDEPIEIDRYVPNYDIPCLMCGDYPTVDIELNGEIIHHVELCGPHTWGEAECLDPENWN